MKLQIHFSFILIASSLITGCSGKSFTLQSYADEYFNNKESKEEGQTSKSKQSSSKAIKTTVDVKEDTKAEVNSNETISSSNINDETTNAAIKSGPGANIAWSSTYKKDKEKGGGALQKSLDAWTEKEWEPAFEGDVNQSKKDEKANEHFTIQHYVDKIGKYMDVKEANRTEPKEPAHYEKMERLPVIGK